MGPVLGYRLSHGAAPAGPHRPTARARSRRPWGPENPPAFTDLTGALARGRARGPPRTAGPGQRGSPGEGAPRSAPPHQDSASASGPCPRSSPGLEVSVFLFFPRQQPNVRGLGLALCPPGELVRKVLSPSPQAMAAAWQGKPYAVGTLPSWRLPLFCIPSCRPCSFEGNPAGLCVSLKSARSILCSAFPLNLLPSSEVLL